MLRAHAPSWGEEIRGFETEKRHTVDERLLQGPPARLPKGHVQQETRFFDPLLQKFREPSVENHRRAQEVRDTVGHLNRAQDIQIMREQPFNILTHESKLEALAPGKDPFLLSSQPKRREGKAVVSDWNTEKDFNILSNLPFAEHHWAPPEDRPRAKETKTEPRKLHSHLVKDFNVVTNRYNENHAEKESQASRLNLLEATGKYMRKNRFDPVTQQFNDPRHEEMVRAADNAREVEITMRAESQLPPSFKGRQSAHYGIISHEVHDGDAINMWDTLEEERTGRYKNRYIVEHNARAQELKGTHIMNSRRLNRIAPERFEEPKRRGYDIIDNCSYGQGPREKELHSAFTKARMTPWEKATDGMPSPQSSQPARSSSTPSLQATLKPAVPAEAGEGRLSASSSAHQLRATPSVRSASGNSAASSSLRRSELRRSEPMGGSLGGPAMRPAPPGQTRPMMGQAPPPAPEIPGDHAGAVFSRPSYP